MTPLYLRSAWRIYLEVRFRDQDMGVAVLQKLKHKYAGLEGDEKEKHADIVKDEVTGINNIISKGETDPLMMEMPSVRVSMVSEIRFMLQSKGITTTMVHHNAMHGVHRETSVEIFWRTGPRILAG